MPFATQADRKGLPGRPQQPTGRFHSPQDRPAGSGGGYARALQDIRDRRPLLGGANSSSRRFGEMLGNSYLFNFADEMAGGVNAAEAWVKRATGHDPGYTPGEAYRAQVDAINGRLNQYAQQHPGAALAANVAGAVANPTSLAGGSYVSRAPTLARAVVRSSLSGAASGAAYGAGSSNGSAVDRLKAAGAGAVTGGVVGAVIPPGARAAGVAARTANHLTGGRLIPAQAGAAGQLRQALQADGVSAQRIAQAVADWRTAGNDAPALLDVAGNNTMRLIRAAAAKPGNAQNVAEDYALRTRQAAGRRGQDRAEALIPNAPRPDEAQSFLRTQRGAQASADYAGPYQQPVRLEQATLDALTGEPGDRALANARAAAIAQHNYNQADEIDRLIHARSLPEATNAEQPPTVSAGTLDRIHIAMRDTGRGLSSNPETNALGVGYGGRAATINSQLSRVDGIAPARANYANLTRASDAVDLGADVRRLPASQYVPQLANASPEVLQGARIGARQNLIDQFGNRGQPPGMFEELAAEPNLQENLAATFGQPEQEALAAFGQNERTRLARAAQIAPNTGSQTQGRAADASMGDLFKMVREPLQFAMSKLSAGATLTDQERELLVQFALHGADQAAQTVAPRVAGPVGQIGSNVVRALPGIAAGGVTTPSQPPVNALAY